MTITHYLLTLLSVLCSTFSDGGLACSAALTILCLYVAHPTGGFLIVGDGVFSIEGLEPDFSTSTNTSSQSEEFTPTMCFATPITKFTILAQEFTFLFHFSFSLHVWGVAHCIFGVCEDLRGIPASLTYWYLSFRCIVFGLHVCHLAGCFPLSGLITAPSISLFSCMIFFCPGVNVLGHAKTLQCGFNFYFYL